MSGDVSDNSVAWRALLWGIGIKGWRKIRHVCHAEISLIAAIFSSGFLTDYLCCNLMERVSEMKIAVENFTPLPHASWQGRANNRQ